MDNFVAAVEAARHEAGRLQLSPTSPSPPPGQPALLSFDDVTTMFHEFGHALHGMFANQQYPSLSGTNVARDFVEFPSQFNEHWALDPKVLAHYARALQDRRADAAGPGRQDQAGRHVQPGLQPDRDSRRGRARHALALAAGRSSHGVRTSTPSRPARSRRPGSTCRRCRRATARATSCTSGRTATPPATTRTCGPRCSTTTRTQWFTEHGGLTRANGDRFRDMILSRGNAGDYAKMYREFRGQDPSIEPMLKRRGISDGRDRRSSRRAGARRSRPMATRSVRMQTPCHSALRSVPLRWL